MRSYQNGLRIQIVMVAIGMLFAFIQVVVYKVHNWRVATGKHVAKNGEEPIVYTP